jgi:hypothetical protein
MDGVWWEGIGHQERSDAPNLEQFYREAGEVAGAGRAQLHNFYRDLGLCLNCMCFCHW